MFFNNYIGLLLNKCIYLKKKKSVALYYQTGKLVTLIMALMKSVTIPTLYILIE